MTKINKNNTEKGRKIGKIMGINVIGTELVEVLTRVNNLLSYNHKFYIVTPNPELVLMAQRNSVLRRALNEADFPVPDATGLAQAAKYLSLSLPRNKLLRLLIGFPAGLVVGASTFFNRKWLTKEIKPIKGRILFLDLIKLADKNRWKVFFLGGKDDEAAIAASELRIKNKELRIETHKGPILNENAEPVTDLDKKLEKDAVDKINKFTPDLLFVAMTNPKQEIWTYKNLKKLNIRGAMCVGGTFRYVAGLSKLPPESVEELELEWLWRLITEPKRIVRIWNAVVVFPWKIFLHKITSR